jgi:hypothetical protein
MLDLKNSLEEIQCDDIVSYLRIWMLGGSDVRNDFINQRPSSLHSLWSRLSVVDLQ